MGDHFGALSRRRLLGAGAAAGATALAGGVANGVAAAEPWPRSLSAAAGSESRFYAGLTLMAGNELSNPTSTVFVKDPFNGSYASTINGYVGTPLDVPAGSVVNDVVFFLYQQGELQQLCAVQLYHPGGSGYEVLLSYTVPGTGLIAVSTATQSAKLPRLVTGNDALCAFVWHGQQNSVCRGIRVDYTPPGGVAASSGGGLVPI